MQQETKNMALLLWIGTFFFGFVPSLILFFLKIGDPSFKKQVQEALNWSITAMIAYMIAFILSFVVIGVFLYPVISICHLVFCVMGAIAAYKGQNFKVPFSLRLIR
ncbi:MAG: DUF4870 domain-containing protein [Mariprofundaceae bacterium]|nr:DUF4870 domain-containing protein [Mariprofundaceae bacterium]